MITMADLNVTRIDGGWRLGMRRWHGDDYYMDVLGMLYGWRLVTTYVSSPLEYSRFWCYEGTGQPALLRATVYGINWLTSFVDEPSGWNRNGQTGEHRPPRVCPGCNSFIQPTNMDGSYHCFICDPPPTAWFGDHYV